ncbi:MAG: hypothetical protein CVU16_07830 [Betaproteobacteria bacterium HGW-Betaproteobacteria-10]|jgi:ABC-type phosphate transport system substrate-binding protein|nr:MAG: hypothetical protein CVU16_07830 [Betaproteobacteria bacterium HGW-Betaproteobacteria-10]
MAKPFLARGLLASILALIALFLPASASAELVVVVNPQSGVERLSKTQVINIFLGHNRELPTGQPASAVDLPAVNREKSLFYKILVNRDIDQMAAYWSRLVFAGSTPPPFQAASTQQAIEFIAANRGAVGYLDSRSVDARVRVVLTLE